MCKIHTLPLTLCAVYVQIMIHDFVLCIYHATAWWFLIELWFHYVIALSFPIQNVTGYEIAF